MKRYLQRPLGSLLALVLLTLVYGQNRESATAAGPSIDNSVGQLVSLVRGKAKALEGTSGMRLGSSRSWQRISLLQIASGIRTM